MIITSFPTDAWDQYAKRFCSSFLDNWPEEERLTIYHEGETPLEHPRITWRRVWDVPLLKDLVDLLKQSSPAFSGMFEQKGSPSPIYSYRHDVQRWCRKAMIISHHCRTYTSEPIAWIDADVVTHSPVPRGFLKKLLNHSYTAYLGRPRMYTETGFVAFDPSHEANHNFQMLYEAIFVQRSFTLFQEWHCCIGFDFCRRTLNVPAEDIARSVDHSKTIHPFINSELGDYMDHCKGPTRKVLGRSDPSELVVEKPGIAYWEKSA